MKNGLQILYQKEKETDEKEIVDEETEDEQTDDEEREEEIEEETGGVGGGAGGGVREPTIWTFTLFVNFRLRKYLPLEFKKLSWGLTEPSRTKTQREVSKAQCSNLLMYVKGSGLGSPDEI